MGTDETPQTEDETYRSPEDVNFNDATNPPPTREDVLAFLRAPHAECSEAHVYADELLLRFINDREIFDAYKAMERWYD